MTTTDELAARLDRTRMARHVAIVMDGNGRWAEARGLPRLAGHREGSQSVRAVTRLARRLGIRALTLYAFSSQNWRRPAEEVAGLMALLREYLLSERAEIMDSGIRLASLGQVDRLPSFVRDPLDQLAADSAANQEMTLSLALSYGGREEILEACRGLARDRVAPEAIDEAAFERRLWTAGLPPLDLLVRTSGELRLSNFLLWQAAHAELVFTDTLWPDFREEALLRTLLDFQDRERRFGLTGAQARGRSPAHDPSAP